MNIENRRMIEMNTMKNAMSIPAKQRHTHWRTWTLAAAITLLGFAPNSPAQTNKPTAAPTVKIVSRIASGNAQSELLYSLNFNGGRPMDLKKLWSGVFTNDSFVITAAAEQVWLTGFEVRQVRLAELARSVEFLSEGVLAVEVVGQDSSTEGNLWRIGTRSSNENPSVKMRAVAAPHIFANKESIDKLIESAKEMEMLRLKCLSESAQQMGLAVMRGEMLATVRPLSEQKVFMVVGSEAGVAGIESLIQAAEQAAATHLPPKQPKSGQ
jgi:hypothetical protein